MHFDRVTRLKIARYAVETTSTKAARKTTERKLVKVLNESTVRGWAKTYKQKLRKVSIYFGHIPGQLVLN